MVVSLVHTSLGSSYLIAHVLHDPPPPTRTASPEQIKDFVEVTPVGAGETLMMTYDLGVVHIG